jgi:hypothetical protein
VAIDAAGLFVPVPLTVPAGEGCVIDGRTSALPRVIPSDLPFVVETWERALREGVASNLVELLSRPGEEVELYFVDARHRYGVLLGFTVVPCLPSDASSGGETIRHGVWHSRHDQFGLRCHWADQARLARWEPGLRRSSRPKRWRATTDRTIPMIRPQLAIARRSFRHRRLRLTA